MEYACTSVGRAVSIADTMFRASQYVGFRSCDDQPPFGLVNDPAHTLFGSIEKYRYKRLDRRLLRFEMEPPFTFKR